MAVVASAPAKLILCGEHAVVYGRPAIAVPLSDLRATAELLPAASGVGLRLDLPDLSDDRGADQHAHPLRELGRLALERLGLPDADLTVTLRSAIPIASGMGSGAAIGTALVRALAAHAGVALGPVEVAELVYTSECHFHGTPSGIDNTVVAFEQAIWFERRQPAPLIEPLAIGSPLTLIVGDTGVRSATHGPVGAVRERWQADRSTYEALFDHIAGLVRAARTVLAQGDLPGLGRLLDANHTALERMGVASPPLQRLVDAARRAGALGAKLSGAGWGGVMFALVDPDAGGAVADALHRAGAARVLRATVRGTH